MDLKSLFNKGKKIVDERGGVESLKEDATELADIAKGKAASPTRRKRRPPRSKTRARTTPPAPRASPPRRSVTPTGRRLMSAEPTRIDRSRRSGAILE